MDCMYFLLDVVILVSPVCSAPNKAIALGTIPMWLDESLIGQLEKKKKNVTAIYFLFDHYS